MLQSMFFANNYMYQIWLRVSSPLFFFPPRREKRERARSAVLPESRILTWSPHYHCWVIPTGRLDENSYHQGAKNRQASQILTFLSITSRCIHLFSHHSPFSMAQEASSPSPNSSLLLPATSLVLWSCSGFRASIFWPSRFCFSVSAALLLLLARNRAQQQKQPMYQSFPGGLLLLRSPAPLADKVFVNSLIANTEAAQ